MLPPEAPPRGAAAALTHELLRFEGAVQCRVQTGAVGLSLQGASPRASELLFSGVTAGAEQLPPQLHEVRIIELEWRDAPEGPRLLRIEAREGQFELQARSLHRHRDDIGRAFFSVLPQTRPPRLVRWGWCTLLVLLRIGPLGRLIARRGD